MSRLYLIRHAIAGRGADGLYYGSTDLPLSEEGLRQACLLAERLSSEKIGAVFSSPLKRALQTAAPIGRAHRLRVKVLDGLREIDFGDWEGLCFEEIKARYPAECEKWLADPWRFAFPGGESAREFKNRVAGELEYILEREKCLVLISHGGPLRVILSGLGCIEESTAFASSLDHASITIVESRGSGWKINAMNDTTHLF